LKNWNQYENIGIQHFSFVFVISSALYYRDVEIGNCVTFIIFYF
jgi:hypothetical protein